MSMLLFYIQDILILRFGCYFLVYSVNFFLIIYYMSSAFAERIMFPEVPIALRLSGHLLLGLVRIYSWKVNYLFQDCNRMVTTIKTTFTTVEVDLPVDMEPAPFDSITLPPTLNLDDLNLDDIISQMNTPDNHQKSLDQITLAGKGSSSKYMLMCITILAFNYITGVAEGGEYVMGYILMRTFPRFDDCFAASNTTSDDIPLDPPPGNMPPIIENPLDGPQDPPEVMREAPKEGPDHFTDSVFGNDDPMVVDKDSSPFVLNKADTPPAMDGTSSAAQQLAGRCIPLQTPNTCDLIDDAKPLNSGMCSSLHKNYERNFPHVSDPDIESAFNEPMVGYGSSQDAPAERDVTPTSHGNEDTLPEDMPSPIREDDSPFKTVRRTPHSQFGGTSVIEMSPSVRTYSLPGQCTPDSDHLASLFPVNDDYADQPEIPGLISSPGGISGAGTGTTVLGSMSARTRAVALFFKDHVPSTPSDEQTGKFSLSRILEGKVRKQAARMFFETMVILELTLVFLFAICDIYFAQQIRSTQFPPFADLDFFSVGSEEP
ncbi:hypothetical protein HU200_033637 [Digitaria exilis]|uniref:Rad21/Rec8-like protein N-terminal domain-containing protein n=1 Tax=Digitaria exilis TaxID=1010633 RepID=A0A835BUW0_9POAL|nr:hypothetical protein HU200_033637 [Digitaria exilis]